MTGYWMAVASRDHSDLAREGGFFQANHGKEAPLKRIAKGDRVIIYSPRERMGAGKAVKAFTAIGPVIDDEPFRAKQSKDFEPFRRRVRYFKGASAEIEPLLDRLSFALGNRAWGQVLRRGFLSLKKEDYRVIAEAMGVGRG